jgi:hypothetical protein
VRGATLLTKRYGPGFRPGPIEVVEAPNMDRCFAEQGDHPCSDPVAGKAELYVDESPPAVDTYTRLLNRLPVRKWVWLSLCQGHLIEVAKRSSEDQVEEVMWAPGASNPAILARPPKLLASEGVVTDGSR